MKSFFDGNLKYYEFEQFDRDKVCVRFYSRLGGVSPEPWTSLNQGGTNGDSRENVIENRRRVFESINRPVESIFDVWQVHGNKVICTDRPRDLQSEHQKADAIFTDKPQITLFMRFADCVPIVLYEPEKKVIGIIHAGWMGTVNKIVIDAIKTIQERYGVNPKNIVAGIGPSIGPDHYQIGMDVIQQVKKSFGEKSSYLLENKDHQTYLNLWKANEINLRESGVEQIEISEICTACNTADWYSHRLENGTTGRFTAVAFLKKEEHR